MREQVLKYFDLRVSFFIELNFYNTTDTCTGKACSLIQVTLCLRFENSVDFLFVVSFLGSALVFETDSNLLLNVSIRPKVSDVALFYFL